LTEEIFQDVTENGHIKILELADTRKMLDWYSRAILVHAVARNDWELLDFLLDKKPSQFDLRFTRMCIREGFIKVMDWCKSVELIQLLLKKLHIEANGGCWIFCTTMNINKHAQI
jgi:hypothetical protein